ncbi:MAG TPA: hypothetical protein VF945_08920 [Polyangia bacterium]
MKERTGMDGSSTAAGERDLIGHDASVHEENALRLTLEAMRNGQRAAIGLLALPASLALGAAATVSYVAAFLERGFETFERSLGRIARDAQVLTAERGHDRPLFGATAESSEQLAKTTARS